MLLLNLQFNHPYDCQAFHFSNNKPSKLATLDSVLQQWFSLCPNSGIVRSSITHANMESSKERNEK